MITRSTKAIILSIAASLCAFSAVAQQCTLQDTVTTCWTRINPPTNITADTAKAVATTNTGTPTATTSSAANALRDFLSVFTAAVDAGSVTESGTSVTLDWNLSPFSMSKDRKSDRLKIQTVFSDPVLAKDVQTPLGSSADAAKAKLSNFDDATTLASYSPVTNYFGRSVAAHRPLLDALERTSGTIAAEALAVPPQLVSDFDLLPSFSTDTKFTDARRKYSRDEIAANPSLDGKDRLLDLNELGRLIDATEKAASTFKSAVETSSAVTKALTKLLNNQPQIYAEVRYHSRDPLIGPNEWSTKGTYQVSRNSLNSFRLDHPNCDVSNGASIAADCTTKLVDFAGTRADPSAQPDADDSLALSVEFKQAKKQTVELSAFNIATPVLRPGTHSLVYSVTYGHPLSGATLKDARLDIAVNYDNVSNDPKKKDRLVATATFSHKVTDSMTPLLSLTYANHADYLQTDRKLGVHFGLSYKIPNKSGG